MKANNEAGSTDKAAEKMVQAEKAKYAGDQKVEPVCPPAGECQGGRARHILPGHCQHTPLP